VFGKLLRRGDNTKVARDSEDPNDYSAMIFINEFWRKNYYGELYLYVNNVYIQYHPTLTSTPRMSLGNLISYVIVLVKCY